MSLTCILGQVMEEVMRDHMVAHLVKNNLIRSSKHGSQQGRSTTTNILAYPERLTDMLENGQSFDILDFAKALDLVARERFLHKLKGWGSQDG